MRIRSLILARRATAARIAAAVALAAPLVSELPHARAVEAAPSVGLRLIATNFVQPTLLIEHPTAAGHLLIGDQVGQIQILEPNGTLRERPFLDLSPRLSKLNQGFDERGLLGLAFHPRFSENKKLFVYYSAPKRAGAPEDFDHTSHISEFRVAAANPLEVDPGSERVLMQIDQPYFNHNGGRMVFGPDGYLYIGVGDGGNANDEGRRPAIGNGQHKDTLLGKILRIDVDSGQPYGIPADNPFAKGGGKPEIYAYGFRNPWGLSFDRGGQRELFASEVGQTLYEEVNIVKKGGNYGWFIREAFVGFDPKNPKVAPAEAPSTAPDGTPFQDPIIAYKNVNGFPRDPEALGISVTGGYVYRGKALPHLQGRYVFGDWSTHWALPRGVLFAASRPSGAGHKSWSLQTLKLATHPKGLNAYVVAFGEDTSGELYLLTNDTNALLGRRGKVYKIVPE